MKTLYLDESGNTGRKYFEPSQPLFVLGGWFVDSSIQGKLEERFRFWEEGLNLSSDREIKSSDVLKLEGGSQKMLNLFYEFISLGAVPVFALQEKRYGLCCLFFEAFFGIRMGETGYEKYIVDAKRRIAATNSLYDYIQDELLIKFDKAVKDKNESLLEEIYHGIPHVLGINSKILRTLTDVKRFLFSGKNAENTINASVFCTVLNLVKNTTKEAWNIVHDEALMFQEFGIRWVEKIQSPHEGSIQLDTGLKIELSNYNIKEITFPPAKESISLLRASDHLVGTVMRVTRGMLDGTRKLNDWPKDLLNVLFNNDVKTKYYTISSQFYDMISHAKS